MLNITEITNTIAELENGDTTFANCQKLASLYIVRDNFNKEDMQEVPQQQVVEVEHELSDILPQYQKYCEIKRKYQMNEVTKNAVINSIDNVCREIAEFLQTLYGSTDMQEERDAIKTMLAEINEII